MGSRPVTPGETTVAKPDETTNGPSDPAITGEEGSGENTAQSTTPEPGAKNNTVMWIIVAASIAVAAVCVIVMTVVVVKKGKQK